MGKRSDGFERRPQDAYDTPLDAVLPLLPFLQPGTAFVEPCAGKGDMVDHLVNHGHRCVGAIDVEPRRGDIRRGDAMRLRWASTSGFFITNPPWTRVLLHGLITHLSRQTPTWLLFDADWMHTIQAASFMPICRRIVSVGRVRWIEGTDSDGKDNAAWYLFDATRPPSFTQFHGRQSCPPNLRSTTWDDAQALSG